MKKNNRRHLILISILLLAFTVFFCCCGIDTSNIAGSAAQINHQEESEEDTIDEYDNDLDDSIESDDQEEMAEDLEDEEGQAITYVLNTNTKKFHYPDCRSVKQMKDKNKLIEETTREDLIERGYDPCGNCNP